MLVHIYRAQTVQGSMEPQPVTISIVAEFPNLDSEAGIEQHEDDAAALVDALWRSLPGGTLDRLFARMAARYAEGSRLRVAKS